MKKVAGGEEEEERKPHLTPCSLSLSLPFSLFLLALQCACGAVSTEQERGGGGEIWLVCAHLAEEERRGNTWGKKGRRWIRGRGWRENHRPKNDAQLLSRLEGNVFNYISWKGRGGC